jgi:hypothetical protein
VQGAELLSLVKADTNKVFGITFRTPPEVSPLPLVESYRLCAVLKTRLTLRTPPENSRGVAHILEHSVLCGSRKYPTKEPFVALLRGRCAAKPHAAAGAPCAAPARVGRLHRWLTGRVSRSLQTFLNAMTYPDRTCYPVASQVSPRARPRPHERDPAVTPPPLAPAEPQGLLQPRERLPRRGASSPLLLPPPLPPPARRRRRWSARV